MARQRMITRTIEQSIAQVMTVDITTSEVSVRQYIIGGNYTEDVLLSKLKKLFETDTLKLVHVKDVKVEEVLLGMTEEDFIKNAVVLPSRNSNKEHD